MRQNQPSIHILLIVVSVAVATSCSTTSRPAPPSSLAPAWTWATPEHRNAGMPAADARGTAVVLSNEQVVLLDAHHRAQWRVTPSVPLYDAAPLLDGDQVVVATDSGLVSLGRADGTQRWAADLGERGSTPVAAGERLLATTWSQRLAAVDRATGALAWTLDLPGPTYDAPAAASGVAMATWDGGERAGLTAVDVVTGAPRWTASLAGGGVSGPAVIERPGSNAAGTVVVVAGDGAAHGFDVSSGAERWRASLPGAGSPEVPPTAVGAADVAVADRDGDIAVLDATTGRMRWSVTGVGAAVRGGPVALADFPTAGATAVALPVDDGRLLLARAGRVVQVLDPPGRVTGLARGGRSEVVLATRESPDNVVGGWVWRP
jgi:outer membrane protein assembly factor BamB